MSDEVQAQLAEAMRQIEELQTQNARLQEALLLREAREFAADQLALATVPDVTRRRLLERLAANPPVVEGRIDRDAFGQSISQAVAAEMQYLSEAAGLGAGRIAGMGTQADQAGDADLTKRLEESFARLGLSGDGLKSAVAGRAW